MCKKEKYMVVISKGASFITGKVGLFRVIE